MSFFVSNSKKIKSLFVGFMIPLIMLSLSLPMFADLPDNEVSGNLSVIDIFTTIYLRDENGSSQNVNTAQVFQNVPISYGYLKLYRFMYSDTNIPYGTIIDPPMYPQSSSMWFQSQITLTDNCNLYVCTGGNLYSQSGSLNLSLDNQTTSLSKVNTNGDGTTAINKSGNNIFTYTGDIESVTSHIQPNQTGSAYEFLAGDEGVVTTISLNVNCELNFDIYANLTPGTYNLTYSSFLDSSYDYWYPMGVYINTDPVPTGDANIDYDNGLISFQDASQQIRDEMNEVLNNPDATDFEKQMAVQVADQKLDQLKDASDAKYNTIVQNFNDDAESVVNSFIDSGSTEPVQYINNLNRLYTDALTQAVTPEQGTFINTQYNLSLNQMQLAFDANYKAELDEVISDEEMAEKEEINQEILDKIEEQEVAYKAFEESDYKSQLLFEMWTSQLSNSNVYRSIFEYLIEDTNSVFRLYIQVPLALTLVSILLATTTVVIRRSNK